MNKYAIRKRRQRTKELAQTPGQGIRNWLTLY